MADNDFEKKTKIALLSNVNLNFVLRKLRRKHEVYATEGYGNELGILLDKESAYHGFGPDVTFLIMDLSELVRSAESRKEQEECIREWFQTLEQGISHNGIYYVSDAYYWNPERDLMAFSLAENELEAFYDHLLMELLQKRENVRVFPLNRLIRKKGEEQVFQIKLFYLGKIPYGNAFQEYLAKEMDYLTEMEARTPRKVLALDLDNTLWGGLAGDGPQGIQLSEDGCGLIYKNVQRLIRLMKESGVLLVLVSKNNPEDAWEVIDHHPHCVLRRKDFAATRINWNAKDQNLEEIAAELNLGLDSFVFWDDQPAERELIKMMHPEVVVPDFPENAEEMTEALTLVFDRYFRKGRITKEDQSKTESYEQNRQREELHARYVDFDDYLKNLEMTISRKDPLENRERLLQLLNKTNQFNLTTRRYTASELGEVLEDQEKKVFLYQIGDRFGDYGITAALIADLRGVPVITDFVLSCRVMGKRVEEAILGDVEREIRNLGYERLRGKYIPTAKNMPVRDLYEKYGYDLISTKDALEKTYEIVLEKAPERKCLMKWVEE